MTLVIAHRGASAYEVENSPAAFRLAHSLGADGIELDVHCTADGIPLVHHDPIIEGMPIGRTAAADLTAHRLPNGEPIPTLADALAAIDPSVRVYIEVKALEPRDDVRLLEVLDAAPEPARFEVHSFDHGVMRRLKDHRHALPTGILAVARPVRPLTALLDAGAGVLWQEETLLDEELIHDVHQAGFRVYAWTVDEPERMRVLSSLGVDAVCTNRPDIARETIA
jgi:glycerophosphoryl diester phosphodiesterase